MSFVVFADGTANLPGRLLDGIKLLPIAYTVNGVPDTYNGDIEDFDVHAYYEQLRGGADIKTSLLNTALFLDSFEPVLKEGNDIVYIAMSSGISGTYNAAKTAADQLMELRRLVGDFAAGVRRADVEGTTLQFAFAVLRTDMRHVVERIYDHHDIPFPIDDGADDVQRDRRIREVVDGLADGTWIEGGRFLLRHADKIRRIAVFVFADADDDIAALRVAEGHGVAREFGASDASDRLPVLM